MCLDEDYGMESSESDFGFTLDRSVAYWESLGDSNIILRYSLNTDTLQFFLSHHETRGVFPIATSYHHPLFSFLARIPLFR